MAEPEAESVVIHQVFDSWSQFYGKFYINIKEQYYIHTGGYSRISTNHFGVYSGYFNTEEEAELALELYHMRNKP